MLNYFSLSVKSAKKKIPLDISCFKGPRLSCHTSTHIAVPAADTTCPAPYSPASFLAWLLYFHPWPITASLCWKAVLCAWTGGSHGTQCIRNQCQHHLAALHQELTRGDEKITQLLHPQVGYAKASALHGAQSPSKVRPQPPGEVTCLLLHYWCFPVSLLTPLKVFPSPSK